VRDTHSQPQSRSRHIPSPHAAWALSIYDGTARAGTVVATGGVYFSFDNDDELIGEWRSQAEAMRSIPRAALWGGQAHWWGPAQQRRAELKHRADQLLANDRRRRRRVDMSPRTSTSPPEVPSKWLKLSDLKNALRKRGETL
jgi:hypothetical protein